MPISNLISFIFVLFSFFSHLCYAEGTSPSDSGMDQNNKRYITKVYSGIKNYQSYFPEKKIVNISNWDTEKVMQCFEKQIQCNYLFTRTIQYQDGTVVKEKSISTVAPPKHWEHKDKEEKYISKIYQGLNSAKKHFPDKEIKNIGKWFKEKNIGCTDIRKSEVHGRSSRTIVAGKQCSHKMVRFIYYTDGTIVKERRIASLKNVWR